MAEAEEHSARLSADFGQLRGRVRGLVDEALATLTQVDGLAPARLDELRDALFHADHPYLLVFVGPFSAGKSSLINALLRRGADELGVTDGPLAVGPVPTTDRIAILRWGSESERRREGESLDSVYFPAPILSRVSFVDTPGLGSVFQAQEQITQRFLHRSDAVFWVMMARQALTAENLDALRALREFGKKTIILLNQADTLDEDERQTVLEYVREQSQARLGWQPPVWLVSAKEGLAARGEEAARHWQASGLGAVSDFIGEQLGDRARLRQKLSTPLQIVQRATTEAQTALAENQARWDELGRAVANLEGQVSASRAQGNLALDGARQGIVTTSRVVEETVAAAWSASFGWGKLPRLVARGLLELLGLGWLARRGGAKKSLLPADLLVGAEGWQNSAEQLAGRLEARDWQDIGDLVAAADEALTQLPEAARSQMVGTVAAPSRYDRSALEEARQALRQLADEERRREETRMAANAQRLLSGVAVGQTLLLLLALGTLVGRPLLADWRPEAPLYALGLLATLFIVSALWLPLSARWQAARFARRWRLAQEQAQQLLDDGAESQLEYGLQLRRDALLPLTRLWEARASSQREQRASLHQISGQIGELEGAIHELGRPTLRERLGLRRAPSPAVGAAEDEASALAAEVEQETDPPSQSEARNA